VPPPSALWHGAREDFEVDFHYTQWQVLMFYVCASLTMAFALLNLLVSGFLVVGAQGLMLRGPPNSVARCVDILSSFWPLVKWGLAASLLSLLATAVAVCWMKLEGVDLFPASAITCTAIVAAVLAAAACKMRRIYVELAIERDDMVRGDLNVAQALGPQASAAAPVDLMSEDQAVIPVSSR